MQRGVSRLPKPNYMSDAYQRYKGSEGLRIRKDLGTVFRTEVPAYPKGCV